MPPSINNKHQQQTSTNFQENFMKTKHFAKVVRIVLAGFAFLGLLTLTGCVARGPYIGVSDGYYNGYRPARPYNYNYNYNYHNRPDYPYHHRGDGYWRDHRGYRR
jgi:hypothetical protein